MGDCQHVLANFKARAIKCSKEIKISDPPNEWRDIP